MRITSGELKGREVQLPSGSRVRPATGFVREMVMSIFTPDRLESGPFADVCAGSGLVGFEALSRGAPRVIFIEADRRSLKLIRWHAEQFGVEERCSFLGIDARRSGSVLRSQLGEERLACAFVDPPFIKGMAQDILQALAGMQGIFGEDALIILRSEDELRPPDSGLELIERRQAGHGVLWLLRPMA